MLLKDLDALYDDLVTDGDVEPTGFARQRVRYLVDLDLEGRCVGVTDTEDSETKRAAILRRSGKNAPAIIVTDKAQYVFGVSKTAGDAEAEALAGRAHVAYVKRLEEAISALDGTNVVGQLRAIHRFVRDAGTARQTLLERGVEVDGHAGLVRFRVSGTDPVDSPDLQAWWGSVVAVDLASDRKGVCQVTGRMEPLARKMPQLKVQSGNDALISCNFVAAERYGASQSGGAQVGVPAALRTHQALNWLLQDGDHHYRVGDATHAWWFAWWMPGNLAFDGLSIVLKPDAGLVREFLRQPWSGTKALDVRYPLRLLMLTLNEARVVVRMDHSIGLGELEARLRRWFMLIEIPAAHGTTTFPSIHDLAEAAVAPGSGAARRRQRDRVGMALAAAAVGGAPLGRFILNAVVARCRAERDVTPARYALLNLHRNLREETVVEIESPASLSGRLLGVLEWGQESALGMTNVVSNFYAAASVSPQRVLPAALKRAEAHLRKLGRAQPGLAVVIKRRIEDLVEQIAPAGGLPARLDVAGQADFALGLWRERGERYRKRDTPDVTEPLKPALEA